jgi:hypothetical protein
MSVVLMVEDELLNQVFDQQHWLNDDFGESYVVVVVVVIGMHWIEYD